MATRRTTRTAVPAGNADDELADKWRSRAVLDAPIAFRAMFRAVNEITDVAVPQPDQECARLILSGLIHGKSDAVMPLLAQVMETANHDDWWRDSFSTVTYAYMKAYGGAFMEELGNEAARFGSDERSMDDLLREGLISDEIRWRGALAAVWLTKLVIGRSEPSRPGAGLDPTYVVYQYCISLGIVSFKRSSGVKAIPPGGSRVVAGLPYTLISVVFGWWGIPWGPIWTLETIGKNLAGGVDVTPAVVGGMVPASA